VPNTIIRFATPGDAGALAQLRFDFRAPVHAAAEDEEEFVARCANWMSARLAHASAWRCWVLEFDGIVAGQLWLQLIEKIPNPELELERHGYITNVYVSPEARGTGAGESLLETALAFCRVEHVDSVVLWPTERSRTLYARHGFAVRDDVMEAILDDNRHL
jgi:GNAT superfamily N-acetyltransferase